MSGGTTIAPGGRIARSRIRQALDVIRDVLLAVLLVLALPTAITVLVGIVRLLTPG